MDADSRALCSLSRQRSRARRRWASRCGGARGTLHPQEARFSISRHAIEYCLAEGKSALSELDFIVFYDKPFLKFERLIETYLAFAPRGFKSFAMAIPLWLEKLFQKNWLTTEFRKLLKYDNSNLLFTEHHLSHAASAFFPSPFEQAAVLTMDGVGEWSTTSLAIGTGNDLKIS